MLLRPSFNSEASNDWITFTQHALCDANKAVIMSGGILFIFLESVSESRCYFRSRPADKDPKPTAFIGTNRKTFWQQPAVSSSSSLLVEMAWDFVFRQKNDPRSGSANHEQAAGTSPQSQRSTYDSLHSVLYTQMYRWQTMESKSITDFFFL